MRSLALLWLAACATDPTPRPDGGTVSQDPGASPGRPVQASGSPAPAGADAVPAAAFGVDQDLRAAVGGHAPDRILVGTHGTAPAALTLGAWKLPRLAAFALTDGGVYGVPDGVDPADVVRALRTSGLVRHADLDHVRAAFSNDPYRVHQWNFDEVNAEAAWAMSTGAGTVVAVIDTGVTSGPLDGLGLVLPGHDFVNGDADASDDHSHGTHVAGTICQRTDNGQGVAGLAPSTAILPVKVLDASGYGWSSDLILGVEYAVAQGADVINMSLGGDPYGQAEADTMRAARDAGVVVVAASGNDGASSVSYPAAYDGVIAVGATGIGGYRTWYSNSGSALDLVAPGGDVGVDLDGDGFGDGVLQETFGWDGWAYWFFQGTSMAAPHVSAVAALLRSLGATADEVELYLELSALDLGTAGWDAAHGAGLLQADVALSEFLLDHPTDGDGDGFDPAVDCDDADPAVHPGAAEVCGDGVDQDCSGDDPACPNVAPTAVAGGPYTGTPGVAVTLDGSGSSDVDGAVLSWSWSFGDGTSATGSVVSKTWSAPGTYTVTLTVTDDRGATATSSVTATLAYTCSFAGTISSGSRVHAIGAFPRGAVIDEWLRWPASLSNLDLFLDAKAPGTTSWSAVAKSTTATRDVAEHVAYTVTRNRAGHSFRWRVVRRSGTATYCIGD